MHPKELDEQLEDALAEVQLRERELRTANSYLLQARKRYDDLLRQYRHERLSDKQVSS